MSFKIKIRPSDKVFSQYIRLRDKKCLKCRSEVQLNDKGLPISHQASHFHGRGKESVRFDEVNVCTLCTGCHMYFTAQPQAHRDWQLERLGQREYDLLELRASIKGHRDDKLALIVAETLLKSIQGIDK